VLLQEEPFKFAAGFAMREEPCGDDARIVDDEQIAR
jgi:hypothetical protein